MAFMKGQAAAEYLVTYGWVLLILVVVVGVLVFSGAFSLANFQQTECAFQPNLPCSNVPVAYVSPTGVLWLKVYVNNGLGFDMKTIPNAPTAAYRKGATTINLTCLAPAFGINQSDNLALFCNSATGQSVATGQMGTFFVNFNYTTDYGTHQVSGRVVTKIEKL